MDFSERRGQEYGMSPSKRSFSSREHQIFLVAGGIILALILVVATFNTFTTHGARTDAHSAGATPEPQGPPPVVEPSFRPIQPAQDGREVITKSWGVPDGSPAAGGKGTAPAAPAVPADVAPVFTHDYTSSPAPKPINAEPSAPVAAPAPLASVAAPAAAPSAPAPGTAAARTATSKTVALPVPAAAAGTAPAPQPQTTPAREGAPGLKEGEGFVVQLGSFADSANAADIARQVSSVSHNGKALTAFQSPIVTQGTTYYRVRLGPFQNRAEAEQVAQLVKQKVGKAASVVPASK
jgi:cell division septation protein DedD